jgi:sugar-phosphatase
MGLPIPDVLVTSEDVTNGKPDPAGFLLAAKQLGREPSRMIVFEDTRSGFAAGEAAGARVIAIATTLRPDDLEPREWLYDFSNVSFTEDEGGVMGVNA